ncbi:hypothetical protein LWV33_03160 [Brucella intermedia]
MKAKFGILVCLALYGCQSTAVSNTPRNSVTLNEAQIEIVKEGIKRSLKDPESAEFGAIKAADTDKKGIFHVCGTVNAKNSFGGYSGQSPYFGVLASMESEGKTIGMFTLTSLGNTKRDASVVMTTCRQVGVIN